VRGSDESIGRVRVPGHSGPDEPSQPSQARPSHYCCIFVIRGMLGGRCTTVSPRLPSFLLPPSCACWALLPPEAAPLALSHALLLPAQSAGAAPLSISLAQLQPAHAESLRSRSGPNTGTAVPCSCMPPKAHALKHTYAHGHGSGGGIPDSLPRPRPCAPAPLGAPSQCASLQAPVVGPPRCPAPQSVRKAFLCDAESAADAPRTHTPLTGTVRLTMVHHGAADTTPGLPPARATRPQRRRTLEPRLEANEPLARRLVRKLCISLPQCEGGRGCCCRPAYWRWHGSQAQSFCGRAPLRILRRAAPQPAPPSRPAFSACVGPAT